MEETKLDKFVNHIFNGTERFSNFVGRLFKNISFSLLALLNGVVMITILAIRFSSTEKFGLDEIASFSSNLFVGLYCIYLGTSIIYRKIKESDDIDLKILKFSRKLYSEETTKLCFEPIIADWKAEYFTLISQNQFWQARWISARYVYAFLAAMFQQSWLGRLVEFLQKTVK